MSEGQAVQRNQISNAITGFGEVSSAEAGVGVLSRVQAGKTFLASANGTEENAAREYEIKEGDTLESIALQAYGSASDITRITDANDISDPNQIFVGQSILIPLTDEQIETENQQDEAATSALISTPYNLEAHPSFPDINASNPDDEAESSQTVHVVSEGESLWTIEKII